MMCWVFYPFIETTFRIPTLIQTGQEMGTEDRNTDVGPSLSLEWQVNCGGFPFSLVDKIGERPLIILM